MQVIYIKGTHTDIDFVQRSEDTNEYEEDESGSKF